MCRFWLKAHQQAGITASRRQLPAHPAWLCLWAPARSTDSQTQSSLPQCNRSPTARGGRGPRTKSSLPGICTRAVGNAGKEAFVATIHTRAHQSFASLPVVQGTLSWTLSQAARRSHPPVPPAACRSRGRSQVGWGTSRAGTALSGLWPLLGQKRCCLRQRQWLAPGPGRWSARPEPASKRLQSKNGGQKCYNSFSIAGSRAVTKASAPRQRQPRACRLTFRTLPRAHVWSAHSVNLSKQLQQLGGDAALLAGARTRAQGQQAQDCEGKPHTSPARPCAPQVLHGTWGGAKTKLHSVGNQLQGWQERLHGAD